MSRETKIILAVVIGLVVICACIGGGVVLMLARGGQILSNATSTQPQDVSAVAGKIADYTLPAGYKEAMSMSLLGVSMAGFSSDDDQTFIFLFQVPKGTISPDQFRQQVEQMAQNQLGSDYTLQPAGTQQATIRGQSVELQMYIGTRSSGESIRQMMGAFEGKGGPAWLMVFGPANAWDQAAVDAFIASLK